MVIRFAKKTPALEEQEDSIIRCVLPSDCPVTANGVIVMPSDRSDAAADARFMKHGGLVRLPYLGGLTQAQLKPWIAAGMSRATWYRRKKEGKL